MCLLFLTVVSEAPQPAPEPREKEPDENEAGEEGPASGLQRVFEILDEPESRTPPAKGGEELEESRHLAKTCEKADTGAPEPHRAKKNAQPDQANWVMDISQDDGEKEGGDSIGCEDNPLHHRPTRHLALWLLLLLLYHASFYRVWGVGRRASGG